MTATTIKDKFKEFGHDIELHEIEARLETLTGQFKVPVSEAKDSVANFYIRQFGVDPKEYYEGSGANETVSIADVPNKENRWMNVRAKLTDIWEVAHESMTQVGLIGDKTGKIKFTMWKNSGLPPMEQDKSYLIENVVTNVWNDKVSLSLNKTSTITEIEDDIEVGYSESDYTGAMVAIFKSSGLIKRCPECNRALKSGTCSEHGNVDGSYDLRIMAVLDDGKSAQSILLNRELTESIWGHTLEDAIKSATEELDSGVVMGEMETALVGRYYTVTGSMADTMILVKTIEAI